MDGGTDVISDRLDAADGGEPDAFAIGDLKHSDQFPQRRAEMRIANTRVVMERRHRRGLIAAYKHKHKVSTIWKTQEAADYVCTYTAHSPAPERAAAPLRDPESEWHAVSARQPPGSALRTSPPRRYTHHLWQRWRLPAADQPARHAAAAAPAAARLPSCSARGSSSCNPARPASACDCPAAASTGRRLARLPKTESGAGLLNGC